MSPDPIIFIVLLSLGVAAFIIALLFMVFSLLGAIMRAVAAVLRGLWRIPQAILGGHPKPGVKAIRIAPGEPCPRQQCQYVDHRVRQFCSRCGQRLD